MTLLLPDRVGAMPPLLEEAQPHRFTLEEYLRMSELGFFEGRRVEFIDGEVLDMASQKDSHAYCVTRTANWGREVFDERSHWVRVQMTLRAAGSSPEPDIAILDVPPTPSDSYASADRAVLLIEVADSTLLADTTSKMSLYASAGVRDYWVLSIPDRLLIMHRQPVRSAATRHGFAYAEVRRFACGELVSPLAAPSSSINPAQLLP
jgi:Uma2 family endonuclease